jgi:transcriptional regulator
MYVPAAFAVSDLDQVQAMIERYPFALLVSQTAGEWVASHLPLLLDRQAGANGTLVGHMARANSQWQEAAGQGVLAVFSGPHAYISPTWYEAQEVVPTWNYLAVHAYGRLEIMEQRGEVEALLQRMIQTFEAPGAAPWQYAGSAEHYERMLRQIVAFRIPLERLEGKAKLNQNHPDQRREKVAVALVQQSDDDSHEIAALMRSESNR